MRLLSTWALRCALGVSCALLLGSLSGCEEPEAAAEKAPVVEVAKPAPQKVVKSRDANKVPRGERLVVLDFSREALGDASAGDRVDCGGSANLIEAVVGNRTVGLDEAVVSDGSTVREKGAAEREG